MSKPLRLILLIVIIPLLLASIAIAWLCYTASGLQFALLQLNHVPNLEVRVRGVTGKLAGPLHVDQLVLISERVAIDIEQLDVDLSPAYLLSGLVEIDRLHIGQVSVSLKPRLIETPDQPIHFLPSFLRISVDELELQRAEYTHTSGYHLVATPLQAEVELSRNRLRARQLTAVTEEFDARGEVVLTAGAVLKIQADLQAGYKLANGPVLRGRLNANGPLTGETRRLTFDAQLQAPHEALIKGDLAFPDSGWSLRGEAAADQVLLDAWWQQPSFSLSKLALRFDLDAAGMRYVGNVVVPEWSPALLHVNAVTHYSQRVFAIERADISVPQTGMRTHTSGSITLRTDAQPLLDIHSNWTALRWPLHANLDQAVFTSAAGAMTLNGSQPYAYVVNGRVATPQWPASSLQARGEFRPGEIRVADFKLQTLQGTASGSATLGLGADKPWQFVLRTQGINPAELQAAWPGSLNLQASGKGQGLDRRAQFDVRLQSLTGVLRDQTVSAKGRLQRQGKRWVAEGITAQWGRAQATAQGVAGPHNDFHWSLRAPQLQQLHPQLLGDVDMSGAVSGAEDTPLVSLVAKSTHLQYAQWQAHNLKLDAQVDVTDHGGSRIDLSAARLAQGDLGVENVVFKAMGRMADHELSLQARVAVAPLPKDSQLSVQLAGHYAAQEWRGELQDLRLVTTEQTVQLQQPVQLLLSNQHAEMQLLCLNADGGRACAQGAWRRADGQAASWNVLANLHEWPLSIGNAATDSARLQARINGQLQLAATPTLPWQGAANLQLTDASIRYRAFTGREESLPITMAELQMTADAQAVQSSAELRISEQSVVVLTAKLDRSIGTGLSDWPLSGVVGLSSSDAKLIPVFVSEVDRASGTLAATLQLSGTGAAPRVAGNVRLLQGELDFYQVNLALRALELDAQINTDQLQFTVQGNAGEGMLNASGDFNWRNAKLFGNVKIKGERLLVADLPEYRVLASPDLRFDIARNQVEVKGEVLIPEALLQPKLVVGAVNASADARFKSEQVLERESSQWLINSEVTIRLGDNVKIDSLGLQGRLVGAVNTYVRTGETAVGSGELGVDNGRYEIYGQKLDIKRGRLIFEKTPLDDPVLDIQAEREVNDITVGVNVRGVLRAPLLQFYSDSSMSQTQIVSYLLLGKPLDDLQSGEATTVRSAGNALALGGGSILASQLGRRIGFEQVGIETDAKNQSAFVLGKFLSPRLFISYGISLTEAINTVKLRYTLSDHWVLKTEAGEAKSADLEYKIER